MVSNTLVAGNDFGCLIGNEFFAGNQALFSGNKKWKPAGNNKQISEANFLFYPGLSFPAENGS